MTDRTEAENDAHYRYLDKLGDEHGIKITSWSAEGADDPLQPHPFHGATTMYYKSHPFWGEPCGPFTTAISGDRWLDLWIAADKLVFQSGDHHHIFIEHFKPFERDKTPDMLTFDVGS